jgi:hypothetical protein
MTIVIRSSSAQIAEDLASFFEALRAGHAVHVPELGGTVALVEADQEVEDMVSLRPEKTGVENTVFVSTKGYAEPAPRIKIAVDPPHAFNATSKSASMAVHDHSIRGESVAPHIAEQAKRFIDLNREVLLDYWDCKIDTAELIERLKPI